MSAVHAGVRASPDGRHLLVQDEAREGTTVQLLDDGHLRRVASFAAVGLHVDWQRRRVAWLERGPHLDATTLATSTFDEDEVVFHLPLPSDPERPQRDPGVYWSADAPSLTALRDGRLALTRPTSIFDPDRRELLVVGGDLEVLRIDRAGRDLLAVHEGRPVRVPLAPNAGKAWPLDPARFPGSLSFTAWHPVADVAAVGGDVTTPEVRDTTGRCLLSLPPGARPCGWTSDGLCLVVARYVDGVDHVELWRRASMAD